MSLQYLFSALATEIFALGFMELRWWIGYKTPTRDDEHGNPNIAETFNGKFSTTTLSKHL